MKALFEDFARYNENANKRIFELLLANPRTARVKTNAYYQSFSETLQHIFFSNDLLFVRIFKDLFPQSAEETCGEFLDIDEKKYAHFAELFTKDFRQFFEARKKMDKIIEILVSRISEEDFTARKVESYDSSGMAIQEDLWRCLLKAFNHQTHHRGQITAFLDQMKIENDISSIAWDSE